MFISRCVSRGISVQYIALLMPRFEERIHNCVSKNGYYIMLQQTKDLYAVNTMKYPQRTSIYV